MSERLEGQALLLGAGFTSTRLLLTRNTDFPDGATPSANMTDNARLDLLLGYDTRERFFWEMPLQTGRLRLGYNFVTRLSRIAVDRQETLNAVVGEDLGTSVDGYLVAVAPALFLVIGPVYADSRIFWKAGVAVGAAALDFDGDVLYRHNVSPYTAQEPVHKDWGNVHQFRHAFWILDWDGLLVMLQVDEVGGSFAGGRFFYQRGSAAVGYRLVF